jgi:hypothetical protein
MYPNRDVLVTKHHTNLSQKLLLEVVSVKAGQDFPIAWPNRLNIYSLGRGYILSRFYANQHIATGLPECIRKPDGLCQRHWDCNCITLSMECASPANKRLLVTPPCIIPG